ncbi:MAG: hypothetical protein II802_02305 [Clostridia bacterium]|nr:hypothetical protein [Clostridia bacterium]
MSIGKDSIQKRVAKTTDAVSNTKKTETKTPSKQAPKTGTAAKKPANAQTKNNPPKKSAPKTPAKTSVIPNVSPEVVEKVIGHKEKERSSLIKIGEKLPTYLL